MFLRTCLFEAQKGCVGAWKKLFYSLEFHKKKLSAICHGPNGLIGDSKVDNIICEQCLGSSSTLRKAEPLWKF